MMENLTLDERIIILFIAIVFVVSIAAYGGLCFLSRLLDEVDEIDSEEINV